ncbi:MAG: hypothetical protein Q9205_003174 [Flavoplaca limonia]
MLLQHEINAFLGRLASRVATTINSYLPTTVALQNGHSFSIDSVTRFFKNLATALTTSFSEYFSAAFYFLQQTVQVALEVNKALTQVIFLLETTLGMVMDEPSVRVALDLLHVLIILVILHLVRSFINFIRDLLDTARLLLLLPIRILRFIIACAGYHVNNNAFLKNCHVDSNAEDIQRLVHLASELRSFQGELEEEGKYVNYILFKRHQIWRNHPHLPNKLAIMVKDGRTGTNQYALLREQYQRLDSYTRRAESWIRVREDRRQRDRDLYNDIAELKKAINRRTRGLQYQLEDQKKAFEGSQDFINGDEPVTS